MAQGHQRLVDVGVNLGQVFLGKYRVDAILGHGGMGVVAKCTHLQLGEAVAIKMLRKDVLLDRDAVERFTREAQAAAKLRSEYVARVSDVGTFENGVPYMVMEFLDGHDLGELLDTRGPLPVPWACELMLQTAEALAEAHSIGVVHRDVKPTNLFVTWRPDGSALIKVLDFGISKAPVGTDMQLTQTQSLLGTPAYMSPEQMRSARLVDARTDIWSLGTVFYELIEGRRPFEAESFSEMCVKVAVDPPGPMVNAPPALQQVILRCLAKSPEQRYANMAELARDLIPFVQDPHHASVLVERMSRMLRRSHAAADWEKVQTGAGVQRGSSPVIASDPHIRIRTPVAGIPVVEHAEAPSRPVVAGAPSAGVELPQPQSKRSKLPFIVLGLCVLVGVGIGMVVALGGGDDPPPPQIRERAEKPDEPLDKKHGVEVAPAATVKKDDTTAPPPPDEPKLASEQPHEAAPEIQMPDEKVAGATPPVVKKDPPPVVRKDPPPIVRRDPPPVVRKDPPVVKKDPPPAVKKDPPVVEPPKPPDPPKRDPFAAPRPDQKR